MAVGTVVEGASPAVFMTLFEPQVRMAVWSRPSPRMSDDVVRDLEWRADGAEVVPSGPAPDWLEDDVRRLGEVFAALSGEDAWRARYEQVSARQCPRFHQDAVSLRLITTYAGAGTEWLFEREAQDDLDARLASTRQAIRRLFPGDVAVMKGSAPGWEPWPDFPVVLHRSPPASPVRPRRVLTMNAALRPETGAPQET